MPTEVSYLFWSRSIIFFRCIQNEILHFDLILRRRMIVFIDKFRFFLYYTALIITANLVLVDKRLRFKIVWVSIISIKVRNHFTENCISLLIKSGTTSKLSLNFFGRLKFGIFLILVPSPNHCDNIIECYE